MNPNRDILVDAVIFDMDGTLVDSTALVETTWGEFAAHHGLDVDLAELLAYAHGRRAADTVTHFLPGDRSPEEALAWMLARESEIRGGVQEIPGAAAFVDSFDPADVALVTSAPHDLATARMAEAGIRVPAVVIGADDVSVGKPSPEGYLAAASRLGREPARVAIFEDADAGIRAATASGARVVVVGDLEGPATAGLSRIPDYTAVRVERLPEGSPEGRYRITL